MYSVEQINRVRYDEVDTNPSRHHRAFAKDIFDLLVLDCIPFHKHQLACLLDVSTSLVVVFTNFLAANSI